VRYKCGNPIVSEPTAAVDPVARSRVRWMILSTVIFVNVCWSLFAEMRYKNYCLYYSIASVRNSVVHAVTQLLDFLNFAAFLQRIINTELIDVVYTSDVHTTMY